MTEQTTELDPNQKIITSVLKILNDAALNSSQARAAARQAIPAVFNQIARLESIDKKIQQAERELVELRSQRASTIHRIAGLTE